MNRKQLVVLVGILFVLLIVFLQSISRDDQVKDNFEPNKIYHFDNQKVNGAVKEEDYEKLIEEIELEEALNEEEDFAKNGGEDQLLDRARRFIELNKDLVERWLDPSKNTIPNVKAKPQEPEIQNPIELAMQAKEKMSHDPTYAKDRLEDLMKLANQNNLMDKNIQNPNSNPISNNTPTSSNNSTKEFGGRHISDNCYIPKGRNHCGPQYIISGAMKCGTTSMYAYLTSHPKVLPLNPNSKLNGKPVLANKEVRFWLDPTYSSMVKTKGDDGAFFEYLDLFYPIAASDPYFNNANTKYVDYITGEASPMYICQFGIAQRIYNHLPEVKIIIMLRNPIDRAYSELWFKDSLTKGKVQDVDLKIQKERYQNCLSYEADILTGCKVTEYTNPFSTLNPSDLSTCATSLHNAVRGGKCQEETQWLCDKYKAIGSCAVNNFKNSLYALQLKEWVETFGNQKNQLLIIKSEDFYEETSKWMEITSKFLGIEDGTEEFNWDTVTGTAFNIVNPGTVSAQGMEIQNSGTTAGAGLKMGATAAENVSQYPDMDEDFRHRMSEFFDPINKHLATLIKKPLFWTINSNKD